jgi:phage baseplate assembly protein V
VVSDRLLAPLKARLANMIARAVVRLVDDGKMMQTVQVEVGADETRDGVERVQNYGFTSVPLDGAEAVVVFVGGRRDHGLAIAVDDRRHRLTGLESGEVAIYTDQGDAVVIRRGGTIEVTAATKVVLNAPTVELAGDSRAVAKGEDLNIAIVELGTAVAQALATMGADPAAPMAGALAQGAGNTIALAVTAFQAAAQEALSTKVKLS